MRDYELVLIINPQVEDEKVPQVLEKVGHLITDKGGAVGEVTPWGRRKLAYPIKKRLEGYFVVAKAKMDPANVGELENQLRLSEDFLRHLVVKVE